MDDKRIGKRPDIFPSQTVSGGTVIGGSDSVNLGANYYARLDMPHHRDTAILVAELKAIVASFRKSKGRVQKVKSNDSTDV